MAVLKRFEVWLLLLVIVGAVWFVFQAPVEEESGDSLPEEPVAKVEDAPDGKSETDSPQTTQREVKDAPKSESADNPVVADPDSEPVATVSTAAGRFEIHGAKSVTEGDGSVVEFTVQGKVDQSLELVSPQVKLVTEGGEEFDRFFLPFDPAPVLEPGDESEASLKYWVRGELNEKLWLEIDGDRVAVDLEKR